MDTPLRLLQLLEPLRPGVLKRVTVHILLLIILSLSTVCCFYPPPLTFVLDHMCLLLPPRFSLTETEASHKKEEEYETVCEGLFHLYNSCLWQKRPISYSVLKSTLLNHKIREGF